MQCLTSCQWVCARIRIRFVIAVMMFGETFISYMLKSNMSIAIIAMVRPVEETTREAPQCLRDGIDYRHASDFGDRYEWSPKVQGYILSAYFWGYLFTLIPAGYWAEEYGGKRTVEIGSLTAACLTLIIPTASSCHWGVVWVLRFCIGLAGGMSYPALFYMIARWAPPDEEGEFIAALFGGALGTVATWAISAVIITKWGWRWTFIAEGAVAVLWCVFWRVLVTDDPDSHPCISQKEKDYISQRLGDTIDKKRMHAPYLKILTSTPFWGFAALHFGNIWGLSLLLTGAPKFIATVQGFDLRSSGAVSALPYFTRMLGGFLFGYIGDHLRHTGLISTTKLRKLFVLTSHIFPGLLFYFLILAGCDFVWVLILISTSMGFNGSCILTDLPNSLDLAPNFAGTIFGMGNCIASIAAILTPTIMGNITSKNNGLYEWNIIFSIGASVYIVTGILFWIFGTGEEQPWNHIHHVAT